MKIIDQTPYFNHETGEISMLDRGRAIMEYGTGWIKEVEGQKQVIAVLGNILDKNYTLLRNITPAGLGASFPFILIGPAGVFVMYVTSMAGMFRAKGDQWGTISGNTFKNERPNLLTRTERMARAIQVFLQRQGYSTLTSVDAILLCSDPSFNVDSIRPIIRVVMRDALERFAISLTQARIVLNNEAVHDIVQRILNPPKPVPPQPLEILAATSPEDPTSTLGEDTNVPASASPDSQAPLWSNEPPPLPIGEMQNRPRNALNKKQWVFLIIMFVVWCVLISVFLFLVFKDQGSFLMSLLP
jgi:hypothetical protein